MRQEFSLFLLMVTSENTKFLKRFGKRGGKIETFEFLIKRILLMFLIPIIHKIL